VKPRGGRPAFFSCPLIKKHQPNLSFLVQIHYKSEKSGKRAPSTARQILSECDYILAADFNLGRVAALIGPALLCHQPILHGHSNEHLLRA